MGKTSKWFRSLLSSKRPPAGPSGASAAAPEKEKKKSKWALLKSADVNKFSNGDILGSPYVDELDANKHAIAVAAATAAVAEAALAAAQAAAEVVRLTSAGGSGRNVSAYISGEWQRVTASIKIQSAFRAYLARRALRALKGLVKLQALVRGHIVRKQSADMLRRMQAMARIQARASASRSYVSESSYANINFSNLRHPGVVNSRNYNQRSDNTKQGGSTFKQMQQYNSRSCSSINKRSSHLPSNWLDHCMEHCTWNNYHNPSLDPSLVDDNKADKILEIDTWKPRQTTRRNEKAFQNSQPDYSRPGFMSRLSSKLQKPSPSVSSEVSSTRSPNLQPDGDKIEVWMAENSPKVHSASSRRGLFVPTTSDCSRSLFGDYISHPSYMANTESSRAKVRSQSAPKQRMQLEEHGISSSFGRGLWELDASSEKGFGLLGNHRSNACLNSHVKRQGTPARGLSNGFSSTYDYRF